MKDLYFLELVKYYFEINFAFVVPAVKVTLSTKCDRTVYEATYS